MVARINHPLIAIVGQTATGKTELSIKLAAKFDGAIISADSWVVRRNVDIGTAKPSLQQRKIVPHYMLDVVEPDEDFSAARYKQEATKSITQVINNGKVPVIVGGTGLYVDAVLYDYSFLPAPSAKVRTRLNSMTLNELHKLAESRGLPLESVDTRNKRRVIRLIETNGRAARHGNIRPCSLLIGLYSPKDELIKRITMRVERMIMDGLIDEVNVLKRQYGWDCEALKGIGYHEWKLYFESNQTLETTKQRIVVDTYNLAKRQYTWFKRNKSIHWFSTPVNYTMVEDLVTTFLNKDSC